MVFLLMKIQMTATSLDTFWIKNWNKKKISFNKNDKDYYIICDNATIHKSKFIKDYLISNGLWMMIIHPYCPSLNAVEKLIISIKQKIYKEVDNG